MYKKKVFKGQIAELLVYIGVMSSKTRQSIETVFSIKIWHKSY
jgi:hypothetical protein